MAGQPLLWLLTLPLRVLPAAWLPLLLKLFAAALAAAILGLLTRTVQLLPWDRPWDNASRFACALPALTACAAVRAGIQLLAGGHLHLRRFAGPAAAGGGGVVAARIPRPAEFTLAECGRPGLGAGHGRKLGDAAGVAAVCRRS